MVVLACNPAKASRTPQQVARLESHVEQVIAARPSQLVDLPAIDDALVTASDEVDAGTSLAEEVWALGGHDDTHAPPIGNMGTAPWSCERGQVRARFPSPRPSVAVEQTRLALGSDEGRALTGVWHPAR